MLHCDEVVMQTVQGEVFDESFGICQGRIRYLGNVLLVT